MVGQYFKRKRELVEIIVVSGSGMGILVMSISIHSAIRSVYSLHKGFILQLKKCTGQTLERVQIYREYQIIFHEFYNNNKKAIELQSKSISLH